MRERVAIGLLEGGAPIGDMPVVATDDGAPLDVSLRERLAPSAPRTTVRMGPTTASEGLPPEVITRILRQQIARVRACYDRGLVTNPNLIGTIDLRFRISLRGSVHEPQASSDLPDDPQHAAVVTCIRNIVAGMSFPSPEGKPVDVSFSLSLSPAPPGSGAR